uniref:Uncharacterized protein MANES_13G037700 n=1 Tax=Rhizophora mucronata TaxID=61149 RepID=A0A2P2K669_RHIMU
MNTKTMRLPPRRVVTSNKRKERDAVGPLKPSIPQQRPQPPPPPPAAAKLLKPTPTLAVGSDKLPEAASNNRLLAGYLAHEYLTKGTLFGQKWDPTRADAVPVSDVEHSKEMKPSHKAETSGKAEPTEENYQRYLKVSRLLKTDGAHIPGIVNPTQLRFFLQTGKQ